jgi:hypothetical protein
MKKFFLNFFLLFIIIFSGVIVYLSTLGIETNKFNNLIINQVQKKDKDVSLVLKKIRIKLDLKNLNFFLAANKPIVKYKNTKLDFSEIKIYFKVISILKSKQELVKLIVDTQEIELNELQKILIKAKPSNFKSFALNNIYGGYINSLLVIDFNKDLAVNDFNITGKIKNTNIKIKDKVNTKEVNFSFSANKNSVSINLLKANFNEIKIENGTIDVIKNKKLFVKGSFDTNINFDESNLIKNPVLDFKKISKKNKINIKGGFLNTFNFNLSETLEVLDYNYGVEGIFNEAQIILESDIENLFLKNKIKKLKFSNIKLKYKINKNKNLLFLEGDYKTNNSNKFDKLKLTTDFRKKNLSYNIDLTSSEQFVLNLINYKSPKETTSRIESLITVNKNGVHLKKLIFTNKESEISAKNIEINNKFELKKFQNLKVITFLNRKKNNDFVVSLGKKIIVSGKIFDSTNLIENISKNNKNNNLKNINKNIEIKLNNILTKSQIPLKKFNLFGVIQKGKFIKISSKSDFLEDKHLDISLTTNKKKTKILEIYSDLARPLIEDYKFFNGINEGNLFFTSVINDDVSNSNLVIENFKVINAPAFATLLTIADLNGIADLLSGDGISFDVLEIKFNQDKNKLEVEEIYAIGSSISILMDGYVDKQSGLVSLRGTMVPAKNLNKLISKIPVIGDILVGKEVGEGIFGISFKMKGLPNDIKTTINPVKTLTPRFITRALEKRKKKNKPN